MVYLEILNLEVPRLLGISLLKIIIKKIGYAGTVFSGIDITTSLMEDGWTVGVNTAGSIGSATGGWVGAKAGASLGAFIGSSFLGVGTVIGAGIGAIIGGVGGGVLGDYVGKEAYKLF